MNKKLLEDYARLIVCAGANIQKDEEVWINAELDQPEFITMIVEECYKAGAACVDVKWHHDPCGKLNALYMSLDNLSNVRSFDLERTKYMSEKLPTMIHILSSDPDAMRGVDQMKLAEASMRTYPIFKPYREAADGKYKWTIASVPNKQWAKKVFPNVSEEEAVEKLWEAILITSRVDGNDPVENWQKHNDFLINQRNKLQALKLVELKYKASNGTDFKVGLIPDMYWGGGVEEAPNKGRYNPNIPSEEVFTSPMSGKAEGTLVASKPLSYRGEVIDNFSVTFKDGKVSEVKAETNQELLQQMVNMDEGASKLGEVALIAYDSPINKTGILFYETLFDENASCHVALGAGFVECLPGGQEMTHEEVVEHGVNDSMIHVDFMIGTKDLSIVGVSEDGTETQIFKDGNWAI